MFSNINEAWGNDPVKEMTNKLSNGGFITPKGTSNTKNKEALSLSDINSLSLISENTNASTNDSDFGPFAPANFTKNKKKHNNRYKLDSDSDDSDYQDTKCAQSIKHLKNCNRCYDKLKDLINSKVNQKFDELILENKLKQLQSAISTPIAVPPTPQPNYQNQQNTNQNTNQNNTRNDTWKETLIIVIGAIIAIFIIFLIVKSLK